MDWVTMLWATLIWGCVAVALPNQMIGSWWERAEPSHAVLDLRTIVTGLLVSVGYYLGAKLGFALTFQPHPVSVLWPPNSILVAGLLLTPPRIWWFLILAVFPAHWAAQLQSHVPPLMILCWFISNCLEAVIGAGLTRYLAGRPIRFNSLRNAGIFCLGVVFTAPFLSSFLDAAFVRWNAWGQGSYWELIRIRFFSNALAALIVAPLIVTWATNGISVLRRGGRARLLEACLLLFGLLAISFTVLYKFGPQGDSALLFLTLPFLLWAAARFGSLGTSTALSIVGFFAIWSASHGHGPFSGGTAEQSALSIQIFLIVLSIPMLFLAAVIEERATAEAELRETHQRMDLAASAADLGIWVWDIVRDEIWVSEKERALFGFTPSDKADIDRFRKAIHPDDRDSMRKAVENSLNTGMEYEAEHRVILPNGQIRWLATRGRVEFSGDGKPTRMRGVSLDVTRRKLEEEALRESEERFRVVADAAPVLIWMSGVDKLCTFFNKAWLDFTGRTIEQELGNGWSEGVHVEDLGKCLETYGRAFDAHEPFIIQYRLRRHDGEYRSLTDNGVPRYDQHGKFLGYIGGCVDVTDLLQKEKALRETEERVTLAAQAAHLGVWELDTTSNRIWMSDAARALFQFEPGMQMTHEIFQGRVHPEDRTFRETAVNQAIQTQGGYEIEYRTALPDGTVRWIAGRGRCAKDESGEFTRLIGVSADVTQRKLAEEEAQRHREEMSRLGRIALLGEMAASIAHEVNQPLAAIINNASAGQCFIDQGDIKLDTLREILVDIAADGHRAHDVISSIRNTIKKGATLRESVDLNFIVTKVAHMFQPDMIAHSCKLETQLTSDLPTIEGDPVQIHQVLINLVSNALDAMRDTPAADRKVQIATKRNGNGSIEVTVQDSGAGVSDEIRGRLFDQFFTTKEKGLGMGLAIVRSIIEAHGGAIEMENLTEGGARFYFTLPISREIAK